jgi:hypothetical protein
MRRGRRAEAADGKDETACARLGVRYRARTNRAQAGFVRIVGESAKTGFSHESRAGRCETAKSRGR